MPQRSRARIGTTSTPEWRPTLRDTLLHRTAGFRRRLSRATLSAVILSCAWPAVAADPPPKQPFTFRDVTAASGLLPDVGGIRGHAAGWGDVDGDGLIDLYAAAFHTEGSKPNQFFRNPGGGTFKVAPQPTLPISAPPTAPLLPHPH